MNPQRKRWPMRKKWRFAGTRHLHETGATLVSIDKAFGRIEERKRPEMSRKAVMGITVKPDLMENDPFVLIEASTIVDVRHIAV